MRLLLPLLLCLGIATAQETEQSAPTESVPTIFGVRMAAELPIDGSVTAFITDPIGFVASEPRLFSLAAFVERDRLGAEVTIQTAQEISANVYYILSTGGVGALGQESSIGLKLGTREGEFFARLQATLQIYGSF